MEVTIKITDNLEGWLGIKKNEIFTAIREIGSYDIYYSIINKNGRNVDVPGWAAKIETN